METKEKRMSVEETETPGGVELPAVSLHAFAAKWAGEWKGGYIQTLRAVGVETFVLKIRTHEKNVELLIQLPQWITETQRKWVPLEDQPSIVNATKELVGNAQIGNVRQHGMDRILALETKSCTIIIELFGSGNILVLEPSGKIAFVHHAREWKGRTLKKGHAYQFPQGPSAWDEWPKSKKEFADLKPFRNVGGWMVSTLGIPPAWVEEWCAVLKRNPTDENALTQIEWEKTRAYGKKIWEQMQKSPTFEQDGKTILPALNKKDEKKKMEIEGVFSLIEMDILSGKKSEKKDTKRENELVALRVNLERQEAQMNAWEKKSGEAQKKGEWIYTHYGEVEGVLNALARARKQKMNSKMVQAEIKKRYPNVAHIDFEKDEVEWEADEK